MSFTRFERQGRVAILTLCRTEAMNRLNKEFLKEIEDHIRSIDPSETAALILTNDGTQVFSAGFDIEEIPAGASMEVLEEFEKHNPIEMTGFALETCPVPVICLVNGKLYGGAMELLMASDIRWASEDSEFCLPPARLGVMYEPTGLWRMIEGLGYSATAEMVFTAAVLKPNRALELGLISRILPKDQLLEEGIKLAQHISTLAPLTIQNSKKALRAIQSLTRPSPEEIQNLKKLRIACFQSEDVQEGKRAFLEKRKPVFKGQ